MVRGLFLFETYQSPQDTNIARIFTRAKPLIIILFAKMGSVLQQPADNTEELNVINEIEVAMEAIYN